MKKPALTVLTAFALTCTASAQTEWSTLFGTTGRTRVFAMETDAFGKVYICGDTDSASTHVTTTAFQPSSGGAKDAFIACLDPTLPPANQLVWGTHVGGAGDEIALDLYVAPAGDRVVVVGFTNSPNFPTTAGAFQPNFQGGASDGFVAEFDPTASGASQLLWASYFGGDAEDYVSTVDQGVGGTTIGGVTGSTNLPTTPSSYQPVFGGGATDWFVARIQPGGAATSFVTYLGGPSNEAVLPTCSTCTPADLRMTQLEVDSQGRTTIGSATVSATLPTTWRSANPFANYEVYVAQLDSAGSQILGATYLGGTDLDVMRDLRLDGADVILVGHTHSQTNFPTTGNAFQQVGHGGPYWSGFLAHINLANRQLLYSTYVAGGGETCTAAARTSTGDYLVTGWTISSAFPVTPGAPRTFLSPGSGPGLGWDSFLMRLRPGTTSTSLVYSTYFGGSADQLTFGLEPDGRGGAILAGHTTSANFPTTSGFDSVLSGTREGFISMHEMLPDGVSRLGTATTPCMTRTHAQMNGAPAPGTSFAVECHDAPANAIVGGLVVGIAQQPLGVRVFNAQVFLNPSLLIGSVQTTTDPLGLASVLLSIPPGIQGTGSYAFQYFWVNPASCAPFGFLTASNALRW